MTYKNRKLNTSILVISSLIIAFFIQNLVEFCGDELEKFYFFFSSFVLLITIAKYFLNNYFTDFINVKTICGIVLLLFDLMLISTFIACIVLENASAPILMINLLFCFSIYNLIYLLITKFWNLKYNTKKTNILSVFNIIFILSIYLLTIIPQITKIETDDMNDNAGILLLTIALLLFVINRHHLL